jgi:preprotein translocase subunit SecG
LIIFLTVLQVLAAVGLIASVLLQSGKSAGVSGAITGGAESVFGKKKGLDEFFSKISTIFASAFLILTLLLSII